MATAGQESQIGVKTSAGTLYYLGIIYKNPPDRSIASSGQVLAFVHFSPDDISIDIGGS